MLLQSKTLRGSQVDSPYLDGHSPLVPFRPTIHTSAPAFVNLQATPSPMPRVPPATTRCWRGNDICFERRKVIFASRTLGAESGNSKLEDRGCSRLPQSAEVPPPITSGFPIRNSEIRPPRFGVQTARHSRTQWRGSITQPQPWPATPYHRAPLPRWERRIDYYVI